ncbi:hypothetical protein ABPG72_007528 [Tetrahymena utriculariae]
MLLFIQMFICFFYCFLTDSTFNLQYRQPIGLLNLSDYFQSLMKSEEKKKSTSFCLNMINQSEAYLQNQSKQSIQIHSKILISKFLKFNLIFHSLFKLSQIYLISTVSQIILLICLFSFSSLAVTYKNRQRQFIKNQRRFIHSLKYLKYKQFITCLLAVKLINKLLDSCFCNLYQYILIHFSFRYEQSYFKQIIKYLTDKIFIYNLAFNSLGKQLQNLVKRCFYSFIINFFQIIHQQKNLHFIFLLMCFHKKAK